MSDTVRLASKFQALRGAAYGVQQSTLCGKIHLNIVGESGFSMLDSFMESLIEKKLPQTINQEYGDALVFRILHWHVGLQEQQRVPIFGDCFFQRANEASDDLITYFVAMPYVKAEPSIRALLWVIKTVNCYHTHQALSESKIDAVTKSFNDLQKDFRSISVKGDNTAYFLSAAYQLGIPFFMVLPDVFRFGTGKHSRILQSTITDKTPHLGVVLSHNKSTTASILRQVGLPVPKHLQVTNLAQAAKAASKIGYPVVIKPVDQEQGRGVYANLADNLAVEKAFKAAKMFSKHILVEKHHAGKDYRFTVFNGQVIDIFFRKAGGVVGDGIHSITELLLFEQQTPRLRRKLRLTGKIPLVMDEEALSLLSENKLTEQSIPPKGAFVALRRKNNVSTGGTFKNLTHEEAHPDNIALAIRTANVLGLDFAGIDFITRDVRSSWLEIDSIICEVNAKPQIGSSLSLDMYRAMLSVLLPEPFVVKIHLIVCVLESHHPNYDQLTRLSTSLACNSFSTVDGIWVNNQKYTRNFSNSFEAAKALPACQELEAGFSVMSLSDVLSHGIPIAKYNSIRFIVSETSNEADEKGVQRAFERLRMHSSSFFLYQGSIEEGKLKKLTT